MNIFDFFNGTKKYKEGMIDTAKAFYDKDSKQAKAIYRVEKSLNKRMDESDRILLDIAKDMEKKQLKETFGLTKQNDIKDLNSSNKQLLVSILHTLTPTNPNDFQQKYICAVQKYLNISTPQTSIDFKRIDEIDSRSQQKIVYQSCMEYLLLGLKTISDIDKKYGDKLFCHFSIKEKDIKKIISTILKLFNNMGFDGVSERYNINPDPEDIEQLSTKNAYSSENSITTTESIDFTFIKNHRASTGVKPSTVATAGVISLVAGGFISLFTLNKQNNDIRKKRTTKTTFGGMGGLSF